MRHITRLAIIAAMIGLPLAAQAADVRPAPRPAIGSHRHHRQSWRHGPAATSAATLAPAGPTSRSRTTLMTTPAIPPAASSAAARSAGLPDRRIPLRHPGHGRMDQRSWQQHLAAGRERQHHRRPLVLDADGTHRVRANRELPDLRQGRRRLGGRPTPDYECRRNGAVDRQSNARWVDRRRRSRMDVRAQLVDLHRVRLSGLRL